MRTKYFAVMYLIFSIAAMSACASTPLTVEPIVLPERAEPEFDRASYESLPDNTQMVVRWSSRDLEAQVKTRLPTLSTSRTHSSLSFVQEELILFGGLPYRRIWLSYVDGTESGMHGFHSQNIYVWLWPSGDIAEIYVTPVLHPL